MADESKTDGGATAAAAGLADMPSAAFGTFEYVDGSAEPAVIEAAVTAALDAGYRHFDCAELYATSAFTGAAFAATSVPRGEYWVTTKLKGLPCGSYEDEVAKARAHIEQLSCGGYADLLLIHWPGPRTADMGGEPSAFGEACSWDFFAANVAQAWRNMQRMAADGVARFVGVSNFNQHHLDALAAACPDAPAPYANQVYVDAVHPQTELVKACQARSIRVMAYRPLVFVSVYEMAAAMGDGAHAALSEAATSAGAPSNHAMVLAWLHARGIVPIAKSQNAERIAANLAASAGSAEWSASVKADALNGVAEAGMMVDMVGGCDEYAAVMLGVTPPADTAAAAAAVSNGAAGGESASGADSEPVAAAVAASGGTPSESAAT